MVMFVADFWVIVKQMRPVIVFWYKEVANCQHSADAPRLSGDVWGERVSGRLQPSALKDKFVSHMLELNDINVAYDMNTSFPRYTCARM